MNKISIEGTPVTLSSDEIANVDTFPIVGARHTLLIFSNGTEEMFIRGGSSLPGGKGDLRLQIDWKIEDSTDRRLVYKTVNGKKVGVPVTPEFRGNKTIDLKGREAKNVWDVLKQHAENIQKQNYPYEPDGIPLLEPLIGLSDRAKYSNAVVGNLLALV